MADILPSQTEQWQNIEALAREHFARAGLREIRTPLLEVTELFSRGIGEATDVVGKEMYSFMDRGERSCTLRPEGTASVVRSVIQNGLLTQGVQRLWYEGPMFRYERPQSGRQRQFHQIGVEFFGLESVRSDAELISIAWDFLQDLGLNDLKLEINTLGTFDDRKKFREKLINWLENYYEELDDASRKQLKTNPLRILDSKNPTIKKLLKDAPMIESSLSDESKNRFIKLKDLLQSLGIPFEVNKSLVRGLDYYCHTAFEITSNELGAQATVCGGGRYDGLVEQLGGPSTPSVGWAIGMERLFILLGQKFAEIRHPDVYLINRGDKAAMKALSLARSLRVANFKVELDNSDSNFSKQFKRANRSSAAWAIVIGQEEIERGEVKMKKLLESSEQKVEISTSLFDVENITRILKT